MRSKSIALAMSLLSTVCVAGWDTNSWPSQTHPRSGDRQDWDLQQAIFERGYALLGAGQYSMDDIVAISNAFDWCRSEYENLMVAKMFVKAMVTNFVNVEAMNLTGGDTNKAITNIVMYTVDSMMAARKAPLNYFDYSFIRSLKGAGPQDTNLIGAPGSPGTNYPAGRTEWYQFDYGKHVLKDVINRMWYVKMNGAWLRSGSASNVLNIATNAGLYVTRTYTWTNDPFTYKSYVGDWDELTYSDPSSTNGWDVIEAHVDQSVIDQPLVMISNATPCAYWKSGLPSFMSFETEAHNPPYGYNVEIDGRTNFWATHRLQYDTVWRRAVNDWKVTFTASPKVPACDFDVFISFEPIASLSRVTTTHVSGGVTNWANWFDWEGNILGYAEEYTQASRVTNAPNGSVFDEAAVYGDLSTATHDPGGYTSTVTYNHWLVYNVGSTNLREEIAVPQLYDPDNFGMTWAETVSSTSSYANVSTMEADMGYIGWDLDAQGDCVWTLVDFTRGYDYK